MPYPRQSVDVYGKDGELEQLFTVTELADALGITARTIRFYEDKGLIAPARVGLNRVYSHRDRARMMLILRGKRLGFSLRDIRDYLDLYKTDVTGTAQLRHLLRTVQERIDGLQAQREAVELTLGELKEIERQAEAALELKRERRRARAA